MYKQFMKEKKGFTLVEIIVVLVILAILAAFTIPAMLGFVNNARKNSVLAEGHEVQLAFQSAFTEEYGGGFNSGGSSQYQDNRTNSKTAGSSFYVITNWSFNVKNFNGTNKQINLNDSSNRIAQKMLNYIDSDMQWYDGTDYTNCTISTIKSKIITGKNASKYAVVIIYNEDGTLQELYYYRNSYMYVLKDGAVSTYSASDSIKFPNISKGAGSHTIND